MPAVAALNVSPFNENNTLRNGAGIDIWEKYKSIISGGGSNLDDRRQLSNRYGLSNDIFVNSDSSDIIYKYHQVAGTWHSSYS